MPCERSYGPGSSPYLALKFETGLTRRTGFRLGASIANPSHTVSQGGSAIAAPGTDFTVIKGEAAFLFRLKPQVPIFFSLGGVLARYSTSPAPGDPSIPAGNEYGVVISLGYDAPISPHWGARFEWLNYIQWVNDALIPASQEPRNTVYDWMLSFGVRYIFRPPER